jgi:TRAP-type C4-dicarboxylate transport system permease small subunit
LPSLGISGATQFVPLIAGGVLVFLFALERIVLRLQGYAIDDVLDDIAPSEIAVEMNNINAIETAVPDVSDAKYSPTDKER